MVGFNANSAQKGIWEIIVGNITLGLVLIGFIYLLYVVPKRISDDKPFIDFSEFGSVFQKQQFKSFLIILALLFILVCFLLLDDKTNLGLCNLYPLSKLEIRGTMYCLK